MESQSKVMTVSYGTFSCTLDGFDDPFTTMQLVAEYFRKLAAQDRYFGGEPLQPDHNALHQIAQDANPYKVDAQVTETGVTLRKAEVVDAPTTSNAPAPEQAPAVETEPTLPNVNDVVEPTPMFTSKRVAPKPAEPKAKKPALTIDEDTASFVEAAMFSSRRGELASDTSEPEKPAAELIAEEDDAETDGRADAAPKKIETVDAPVKKAVAEAKAPTKQTSEDIEREEAALERLLETTNSKMDNPAHTRKSNALERLKAAVAATEAERRLQSNPSQTKRPEVKDLAKDAAEFKSRMGDVRRTHEDVVKISRPKAKKTGDRARGAFATLILGNDQRVGQNDAAEAAASVKKPEADGQQPVTNADSQRKPALKIVRPETTDTPSQRAEGFTGFAQQIGANTLHELLEASAAYLSIVEDEPRFSQDRILQNVSGYLSENEISDDAATRSLNRLMRDGRILRVKQNSYTISKSMRTGYQVRMAG